MICCTLLYVFSSIAIILMGKTELIALLNLSSWCLVVVEWLFLAVSWVCLRFVIAVFRDHTHLLLFLFICYAFVFCLKKQDIFFEKAVLILIVYQLFILMFMYI